MDVSELKKIKGVVVAHQDLGLYEGLVPVLIDEVKDPVLHWKGAKIPSQMWNQIVCFMRWTYEKYKSESQLRLYYNEVTNEWKVAVFPQHVETGMSSKEIPDHVDREKVMKELEPDDGWREAGTVHHHCAMSAFQSGTDLNDEKDKNGLHITLGDMEQSRAHGFHARASFRKIMYDVDIPEWIDSSFIEDEHRQSWASKIQVAHSDELFPEDWKLYLIPKPKAVVRVVSHHPYHNTFHGCGYGGATVTPLTEWEREWDAKHGGNHADGYSANSSMCEDDEDDDCQTTFGFDADCFSKEEVDEVISEMQSFEEVLCRSPFSDLHPYVFAEYLDILNTIMSEATGMFSAGITEQEVLEDVMRLQTMETSGLPLNLNLCGQYEDVVEYVYRTRGNTVKDANETIRVSAGSQPTPSQNYIG